MDKKRKPKLKQESWGITRKTFDFDGNYDISIVINDEEEVVADIYNDFIDGEAYARLVQKCPDMYRLLKHLRRYYVKNPVCVLKIDEILSYIDGK